MSDHIFFSFGCDCGPSRGFERIRRLLRKARNRLRDAYLWRKQGRPTEVPIVLRRGLLYACPHGKGLITGWHWSVTKMPGWPDSVTFDGERIWDLYSANYPVTRVPALNNCTFCVAGTS